MKLIASICAAVVVTACALSASAQTPAVRDPLTFADIGLYCGWGEYLVSKDTPFDLLVVQGNGPFEGRSNAKWGEFLKRARANGKRVIADLNPQVLLPDGTYTNISLLPPNATDEQLDAMVRVIGEFFAEVDINELTAVTLCEEQVFWNGQDENLTRLYEKLKAKYDVPVWQWYSGSSAGNAPGISGFPNIKADGWLVDEYHPDQPDFEKTMRGYVVIQKPMHQIIWAGGEKASVPFIPKRFWENVDVCRKYDISTGYFTHYGEGSPWGFSDSAPRSLKVVWDTVHEAARRIRSYSAGPVDTRAWDFVPWEIPTIPLAFTTPDAKVATYEEKYTDARSLRFANDAWITGFANLRCDLTPLQLRPRTAGPASSTITYAFEAPFQISKVTVSTNGTVDAAKQGTLTLSVISAVGETLGSAELKPGRPISLTIPGADIARKQRPVVTGQDVLLDKPTEPVDDRRFQVALTMTGNATAAGDVLAGIDFIKVNAEVAFPAEKKIDLIVDGFNQVSYREDFASARYHHTAEVKHAANIIYSSAGLHANAPTDAVEIIQKFDANKKVRATRLRIAGHASASGTNAHLGIGISTDGVNLLSKTMTETDFSGELDIDLTKLSQPVEGKEFYVHVFLDGGYGVVSSYTVDGMAIE